MELLALTGFVLYLSGQAGTEKKTFFCKMSGNTLQTIGVFFLSKINFKSFSETVLKDH